MYSLLETVKKAGAYLVVALLALLMGAYAFVDPNATDAARRFFVFGLGPGDYNGETISWKVFNSYYARCKDQEERFAAQFGKLDKNNPMFANFGAEACVRRSLRALYALNEIGDQLEIHSSIESIKNEMADQARELASQQQVIHEDERVSAQEYYSRLINQSSFEVRMLERVANFTRDILTRPIAIPLAIIRQKTTPAQVSLDLRMLRWDNKSMLEQLKSKVQLSETDIKKQYEAEQANLDLDKRQSLAKERPYLEQRMKAEKARKQMAEIKQKLSGLKSGFQLDEVSQITGQAIQNASGVSLDGLDQIKAGGVTYNLDSSSFYKSLMQAGSKPVSSGPHQDGSYTVYVEIQKLNAKPESQFEADIQADVKKMSEDLGRELSNEILEANGDAESGGLQLEIPQ